MRLADRIRRACSRLHRDESGTTLFELVVTMSLLMIFMGMFTGAILLISKTTIKVESISTTAAQAESAFQRLDREVRYANAISTAAFDVGSGMWHVEWDSTRVERPTDDTVGATDVCTQLRIDPVRDTLEMRTWNVVSATPGYDSVSAWTVLASYVTNGATQGDQPFGTPAVMDGTAAASSASVQLQQLAFKFVTASPNVTDNTTTTSSYTFTAQNSADALGSDAKVCQEVPVGAAS